MRADPDPTVTRFVPDPGLVARAHNETLGAETISRRFVRQRWEESFAAVRVGLAAMREIWPSERDQLDGDSHLDASRALDALTLAYVHLDAMSDAVLGSAMVAVQRGVITTHEQFDELTEGS